MTVVDAQLIFENLGYDLCKITTGNIVHFSAKKSQNNVLKSNFTSHGKPKAQAADSVKTLDEIEKIKKYFLDRGEYRNYCLFIVGITTGYRIGDLLNLKVKDFLSEDYSWKREIDIIEQKTNKRRKIPITPNIKDVVNFCMNKIGGYSLESYLFKSQKGKNTPIGVSTARRIFNDMAINLGLPYHCSTHFLRKTFAYWFLQIHKNDMSALATLQDILNHSSEKMTLKYCGIEKEKQEQMILDVSKLW